MTLNKKNFFIFFSTLFIFLNFITNSPVPEVKKAQTNKSMLKHSQDHLSNGVLTSKLRAENSNAKRCTLIEEGLAPCEFVLETYQYTFYLNENFTLKHFGKFFVSSSSARAPPQFS